MKKYLSIILSILTVMGAFFYVKNLKESTIIKKQKEQSIGSFFPQPSCAKQPNFLKKAHIYGPVAIDLSQQRYKGLAFLYAQGMSKALHLKRWEKFDHFSTYALTPNGNMFLTPMPYISIKKRTFEFQKNIYRLDTNSGKLEVWLTLQDVHAGAYNPYGIIALVYDCDDNSLWVSAIDESDYEESRGVIYHIDVASKEILQRLKGVDALSLALVKSKKGKFLLYGGAKESGLYALKITDSKVTPPSLKLLDLWNDSIRIRKIKVVGKNSLVLQAVPFSYTLIAQTSNEDIRQYYRAFWDKNQHKWHLKLN